MALDDYCQNHNAIVRKAGQFRRSGDGMPSMRFNKRAGYQEEVLEVSMTGLSESERDGLVTIRDTARGSGTVDFTAPGEASTRKFRIIDFRLTQPEPGAFYDAALTLKYAPGI